MTVTDYLTATPIFTCAAIAVLLAALALVPAVNNRLRRKHRVTIASLLLSASVAVLVYAHRAEARGVRYTNLLQQRLIEASLRHRIFVFEHSDELPTGDEDLRTIPPDIGGCAGLSGTEYMAWRAIRLAKARSDLAYFVEARELSRKLHPTFFANP